MNKILAGILKVAEAGAVTVIPGAAAIDTAARGVIGTVQAHGNTETAVEQAILTGFDELALLKPETIYDMPTFKANIVIAHDAVIRAIAAIKKPEVVEVPVKA